MKGWLLGLLLVGIWCLVKFLVPNFLLYINVVYIMSLLPIDLCNNFVDFSYTTYTTEPPPCKYLETQYLDMKIDGTWTVLVISWISLLIFELLRSRVVLEEADLATTVLQLFIAIHIDNQCSSITSVMSRENIDSVWITVSLWITIISLVLHLLHNNFPLD